MNLTFLLLKLIITASLCYWLFSNIEFQTLRHSLERIGAFWIVAGVLLHMVVYLLGALRWWQLLTHTHTTTPFLKVFPSYYLGVFFNNFLPTGIGGDAVRILHLRIRGISTKLLISATFIDRIIGITTVIIMGLCGLIISKKIEVEIHSIAVLISLIAIVIIAMAILLSERGIQFMKAMEKKYQSNLIIKWLFELMVVCYSYRSAKIRIFIAFVISAVGQSLIVLVYYIIGSILTIDLPPSAYFIAIPAVFLASSLPISIGGLGVREGTLVAIMITFGVNPQIAINLSLIYLIVFWLSSLPGSLVMLISNKSRNYVT
jgi:glycosyltransferase 2 family protein